MVTENALFAWFREVGPDTALDVDIDPAWTSEISIQRHVGPDDRIDKVVVIDVHSIALYLLRELKL